MIITLYIYHGYDKEEPTQEVVDKALKNKNGAIALLFISRFLSGFAAGMSLAVLGRTAFFYIRHVLRCLNFLLKWDQSSSFTRHSGCLPPVGDRRRYSLGANSRTTMDSGST